MIPQDFDFISNLLKVRSGLALTPDKIYLLEGRLVPVARACGLEGLPDLIRRLRTRPDEALVAQVVDAMTTNESMFFRDQKPFTQLRDILLPRLRTLKPPGSPIRIWSAACSTGQEPYSVAMCLLEDTAKLPGLTFEIIATDISPRVLRKAEQGIYSQFEVQRGLPIQMLLKYFQQLPDSNWQLKNTIRRMVTYRPLNLLDDYRAFGTFDIVLCRNVLIYFDEATKRGILDKISRVLSKDGVLMLGSTETIIGINDRYRVLDNERGIHILAA